MKLSRTAPHGSFRTIGTLADLGVPMRTGCSCWCSRRNAAQPPPRSIRTTSASPVKNLATMFTGLFGPHGLTVDSEATLPGEQPHSAHFNSDFQSNFGQFGTALVGQLVTVPLPSPARDSPITSIPASASSSERPRALGPSWPNAPRRSARVACRSVSPRSASPSTPSKVSICGVPAVFTHDNARTARRPTGRGHDESTRLSQRSTSSRCSRPLA